MADDKAKMVKNAARSRAAISGQSNNLYINKSNNQKQEYKRQAERTDNIVSIKPLSKEKAKDTIIKTAFKKELQNRSTSNNTTRNSQLLFGSKNENELSGSNLLGINRNKEDSQHAKENKEGIIKTSAGLKKSSEKVILDNKLVSSNSGIPNKTSILLYGSGKKEVNKSSRTQNNKGGKKGKRNVKNAGGRGNPIQKSVVKAQAIGELAKKIASSAEDPTDAVKSVGVNAGKKAVRKVLKTIMALVIKIIMTAVSLISKAILAVLPGIIMAILPVIVVVILVSSVVSFLSGGGGSSTKPGSDFKEEYLSEDPLVNDVLNYAKALCDDNRHGYTLDVTGQGQCTALDDYDRPDLCCAQFVSICYHNCGANLPVTAGATSLCYYLEANDDFIEVTNRVNLYTEEGLVPGDIFLMCYLDSDHGEYDHTEIYYSKGKSAGAHSDRGREGRSPRKGDQGDEVSIVDYYEYGSLFYEVRVFRYIGTSRRATTEVTSGAITEESTERSTEVSSETSTVKNNIDITDDQRNVNNVTKQSESEFEETVNDSIGRELRKWRK